VQQALHARGAAGVDHRLRELVETVCAITHRRRLIFGLGGRLSMAQARMLELLPVKVMTRDNVRSMQVPSVCSTPFPFGIEPAALEALAPSWLAPSSPRGRYPALRTHAGR